MLTGVPALIIAAATAALPFTPPAGWVQMPSSAFNTQISDVWKGPQLAGGKHATFSIVTVPFVGSVSALAGMAKNGKHTGPVQIVSNTPVTVCGVAGRTIVARMGSGAKSTTMQQEVLSKNARGYMLIYTRPSSAAADTRIAALMKQFCPAQDGGIPSLTPPNGWHVDVSRLSMQSMGMWMGTHPGEVMMLMKTTQPLPLSKLAGDLHAGASSAEAKKYVTLVSQRQTQLCGNPAIDVTMQMKVPSFPMVMQQVVTQAKGTTYLLNYMHPASVASDPAAQASLQTLCASGSPQPAPSSTPSPLPSSLPSASPSPTATPLSTIRSAAPIRA